MFFCQKLDNNFYFPGVSLCPQAKTEDGFDLTFGTNHFGHFLLTELLSPLLKSAAIHEPNSRPRIVIVSALAHKHAPINWDDINYEGPNFNSWFVFKCFIYLS